MRSWIIVAWVVVSLFACKPANSPDADISYVEAVALEGTARRAVWPAFSHCKQQPHPAGCDAFLDLILDTLFRARADLEHWGEWGLQKHYACLMTEAQTYLAQMDQKSLAVKKLDPLGRNCPR